MNSVLLTIQYFCIDVCLGAIRFPIWWYSKGLVHVVKTAWNQLDYFGKSIAVGVWVKNLFVPMFGQRDWQSRIISIFVRLGNIVFRSIALAVWACLMLLLVLFYIIALPTVVLLLILSFIA